MHIHTYIVLNQTALCMYIQNLQVRTKIENVFCSIFTERASGVLLLLEENHSWFVVKEYSSPAETDAHTTVSNDDETSRSHSREGV